ncbi:hypothetical protein C8258_11325 [Nocardia sp. MDA0666]|nr:hypothetical protein C8258_11325 [Nocardia sp. MDA0666]
MFDRCDSAEPGPSTFFDGAVSGTARDDGFLASGGGSTPDAGGALPADGADAPVRPLPPPDVADGESGAASDEAGTG